MPSRAGIHAASPARPSALGEPLTVGWLAQGAVNNAEGGEAQLNSPLYGPEGSATIRVNGTSRDGTWTWNTVGLFPPGFTRDRLIAVERKQRQRDRR